jgi:hypothetical protein
LSSVCYYSVIQNLPLFLCGAVKYYSLRAVLFVIKNVPSIAQGMMLCVFFLYILKVRGQGDIFRCPGPASNDVLVGRAAEETTALQCSAQDHLGRENGLYAQGG